MDGGIAIKVDKVSKIFKLPHEKNTSIKSAVVNFYRHNRGYDSQSALEDISFEIKKGEFFGIVGRNGSGKSTLLKLLAGIYTPTQGGIQVAGKLMPFIELGVGFNPELTGRENVFLNGALLGFNREEMKKMYKDIVDFAELDKFMDQKLKNYSSGMQVRLAFSIAIRAQSDILLIDEVLAVGDAAFQQKCFNYFRKIKEEKRTVVFVSHDMSTVQEFCDRALLIDSGRLQYIGNTNEAASRYLLNSAKTNVTSKSEPSALEFSKVKVDKVSGSYKKSDKIRLTIQYTLKKDTQYDIGMSILKNGLSIYERNTKDIKLPSSKGEHILVWEASASHLVGGVHQVDVAAFTKPGFKLTAFMTNAADFFVEDSKKGGLMDMDSRWLVEGK